MLATWKAVGWRTKRHEYGGFGTKIDFSVHLKCDQLNVINFIIWQPRNYMIWQGWKLASNCNINPQLGKLESIFDAANLFKIKIENLLVLLEEGKYKLFCKHSLSSKIFARYSWIEYTIKICDQPISPQPSLALK